MMKLKVPTYIIHINNVLEFGKNFLIVKPSLSKQYQDFISIVNFLTSLTYGVSKGLTTITLAVIDHDSDTSNFEASPWSIETSRNILGANKIVNWKKLFIGEIEASQATLNTHPWISNTFSSN